MNYDNLNKVYNFWREKLLPHLTQNFSVNAFDVYLRQFSFLPAGKWLRDMEMIKFNRIGFAIDPEKFLKKFKSCCVAYNPPIKPEDGIQRIIYQISPTLHAEVIVWAWIEHDILHSYASCSVCYHEEKEYFKFVDDLYQKMRRTGNTEENPTRLGFLNTVKSSDGEDVSEKK